MAGYRRARGGGMPSFRNEGEETYRYLVATDLTWRTTDIVQAHTLRWLVEVFIEDWKSNEGWGKLTKQTDPGGSSQSLILSLLVDHCQSQWQGFQIGLYLLTRERDHSFSRTFWA